MSETPKRPGSKDISELKARLGLKKGGPGAQASGGSTTSSSSGSARPAGVVPPPGVSVPAPPGARPAQPVVPNAADDPFGAMNAMAQAGTMTRAPEIIIVNDGKPVENVGTSHHAAGIAKLAAVALVPLVLGVIVGQIAKDASFYNGGIRDAKGIGLNVTRVKKNLVELRRVFEDAAKKGYRPDKKLTAGLDASFKEEINADQVFQAKQNALNPELSGQVLAFYSGFSELRTLMADHLDQAKADDLALGAATKAAEDAALTEKENAVLASATKYRYAVVLANDEKGGAFGAQVVELGPPFCGDGKQSSSGSCSDAISGFGYRTTPGDGWVKADVAKAQPGQPVPPKQIIPLVPGGVVDALIAKSDPSAAQVMYRRRVEMMAAKVEELINKANVLETKLRAKSNEGERFSFFL